MNGQSAGNLIIEKYQENKSSIKTARELNIPYREVYKTLKREGLMGKRKKQVLATHLNYTFFDTIDTEAKAYFYGLLKADGYINIPRNLMSLRLQSKDEEILIKFCDVLNLPHGRLNKIKSRRLNQSESLDLSVKDDRLVEQLLDIKTQTNKVPEHLAHHFIRGYFDGDGSINYRNVKKVKFSMNIMGVPNDSHMLDYIADRTELKSKYLDKRSNLPFLQTVNKEVISSFRKFLYKDATIYLTRKRTKFDLFQFYYDTSTTKRKTSLCKEDDIV